MKGLKMFKQYEGLPREIYILAFQRFINSLGGFVYPFLALFLSKRVGIDTGTIGTFMMIASFIGVPGAMIGGHLADRYGRKKLLVVTSTIGAIIYIICGFLGNSIMVAYLVILTGLTRSLAGPASGAMTADLTTPEQRKASYSLLYYGMNVGLAFGFFLAGFLFENYTSWLFWGDGITTLLSIALVIFFIPDTKPTRSEINEINKGSRTLEKEEKGIITAIMNRPFLFAFVVINAIVGFVYSQHGFIMPMYLESLFPGNGAENFSRLMMTNTIMVIALTPLIVSLTHKIKPIVNIIIATATYVIGFGLLGTTNQMMSFMLITLIWTAGEIIASVNTGVYISNHSPVNHRGRFNSIIGIIRESGRSIAPFVMGKFLLGYSYSQGWFLTAFIGFIALILLVVLYKSEKKHGARIKERLETAREC